MLAQPSGAASPPTILLVGTEDAYAAPLRGLGVAVQAVPDSAAAVAWLKEHAADIVVAGPDQPEADAVAFFRDADARAPGIKKILLTRHVAPHGIARSLNSARVDFFLVHPSTPEEVAQAVDHVWGLLRLERERDHLYRQNTRILEELRTFNTVLEQRVNERTDQLAQTNTRLAAALREIEQKNRALMLLNESLNIQATVDPLTGLFNRREFRNRLLAEWARFKRHHRPTSLLMVDIDHFKNVNDSHGHECGDAVLQTLGAILRAQQRRHDVTCRYGGEEFVVLLPETLLDSAFLVAEAMRKRVGNHVFRYKELRLQITISLGVAGALEQNPPNEDDFVKLADKALYRAKADGRNRTIVLDTTGERVQRAGT